MQVVTEEKFKIAREVERIAQNYSVPRSELLLLVKLGFESGQKDGLTTLAMNRMGTAAEA